jgi:hypothetical protein
VGINQEMPESNMAKPPPNPRDLNELMHALPQELQDMILDFTLTTTLQVVRIDPKTYRPPPQLAIDRATRTKFAKIFYQQTLFYFAGPRFITGELGIRIDRTVYRAWEASLSREHAAFIQRFEFVPMRCASWRMMGKILTGI